MRFGGPIFQNYHDPEGWVSAVNAKGYRAAYCPLPVQEHSSEVINRYAKAANDADIVIAEVGAWSNPLSPDDSIREKAVQQCKTGLWLADEIGARCCVNIAGSRGDKWDGPCALDMTEDTFALIVDLVRDIIDSVKPRRTYYTLEGMPWMYPDGPDCYLRLMQAIDRPQFAAHLDPVNWVNSPERFFKNSQLLEESFSKLGSHIRSIHAKDVQLQGDLTVHLPEVRIGLGGLDYQRFLTLANQLHADTPFMLEHLPTEADYDLAAAHVRKVAQDLHITL